VEAQRHGQDAISLLNSGELPSIVNVREAINGATIGVDLLSEVVNPGSPMGGNPPMPRVKVPGQDISLVEQANANFQYALDRLNQHHV
jgi:hypothetical protein